MSTETLLDRDYTVFAYVKDGMDLVDRLLEGAKIVSITVKEGDAVAAGQPLLIMDAMKMQHEIKSPARGYVRRIAVDSASGAADCEGGSNGVSSIIVALAEATCG